MDLPITRPRMESSCLIFIFWTKIWAMHSAKTLKCWEMWKKWRFFWIICPHVKCYDLRKANKCKRTQNIFFYLVTKNSNDYQYPNDGLSNINKLTHSIDSNSMFSKSSTFLIFLNVLNDIFPYMEITTLWKRLTNLIFFFSQILSFVEKCKYPIFQIRVNMMATAKPLPAKLVGKCFERFFWNVVDRFVQKGFWEIFFQGDYHKKWSNFFVVQQKPCYFLSLQLNLVLIEKLRKLENEVTFLFEIPLTNISLLLWWKICMSKLAASALPAVVPLT